MKYTLWDSNSAVTPKLAQEFVLQGKLPHMHGFSHYAGGFCVSSVNKGDAKAKTTVGRINITLTYIGPDTGDSLTSDLVLMLFDDQPQHWKLVRDGWDTHTCEAKSAM